MHHSHSHSYSDPPSRPTSRRCPQMRGGLLTQPGCCSAMPHWSSGSGGTRRWVPLPKLLVKHDKITLGTPQGMHPSSTAHFTSTHFALAPLECTGLLACGVSARPVPHACCFEAGPAPSDLHSQALADLHAASPSNPDVCAFYGLSLLSMVMSSGDYLSATESTQVRFSLWVRVCGAAGLPGWGPLQGMWPIL